MVENHSWGGALKPTCCRHREQFTALGAWIFICPQKSGEKNCEFSCDLKPEVVNRNDHYMMIGDKWWLIIIWSNQWCSWPSSPQLHRSSRVFPRLVWMQLGTPYYPFDLFKAWKLLNGWNRGKVMWRSSFLTVTSTKFGKREIRVFWKQIFLHWGCDRCWNSVTLVGLHHGLKKWSLPFHNGIGHYEMVAAYTVTSFTI